MGAFRDLKFSVTINYKDPDINGILYTEESLKWMIEYFKKKEHPIPLVIRSKDERVIIGEVTNITYSENLILIYEGIIFNGGTLEEVSDLEKVGNNLRPEEIYLRGLSFISNGIAIDPFHLGVQESQSECNDKSL